MFVDFNVDGVTANGEDVIGQMSGCRFEPGLLRPYVDRNGQKCVTVNTGHTKFNEKTGDWEPVYEKRLVSEVIANGVNSPVLNATTLRRDEWLKFDQALLRAARQRLRAWSDLVGQGLTFGGFNGMAKTVLEHERMTDPGSAVVDMDGLSDSQNDQPQFQLEGLPLPITHSGFYVSSRKLAVSRNTGTPLDTTMLEACGRRVAESIEKTLIGIDTGMTYGTASRYDNTPTVYGYTNHPDRITKTDLTTPTGASTSDSTLADVLAMMQLAYAQNFFGPFMLYHSSDWDQYLDDDYGQISGTNYGFAPARTLRERLRAIDGIVDVRRLDFFSDTFTLLLVQMTSDVVRAVNGMDLQVVQWESRGGMQLNFKVMAIMVPQIRSQYIGTSTANTAARCGVVHATTV